jgi:hypothetical protein
MAPNAIQLPTEEPPPLLSSSLSSGTSVTTTLAGVGSRVALPTGELCGDAVSLVALAVDAGGSVAVAVTLPVASPVGVGEGPPGCVGVWVGGAVVGVAVAVGVGVGGEAPPCGGWPQMPSNVAPAGGGALEGPPGPHFQPLRSPSRTWARLNPTEEYCHELP